MFVVPEKRPPLVYLMAPHRNEMAARPFQMRLANTISTEIRVQTTQNDKLISEAAFARLTLLQNSDLLDSKGKLYGSVSDAFAQILRMQDIERRFEQINHIYQKNGEKTLIVEVHAASARSLGRKPVSHNNFDDDVVRADVFEINYQSVNKTNIKIGNLWDIKDPISALVLNNTSYFIGKVAETLKIDVEKLRKRLSELFGSLAWPKIALIVEVPGTTIPLQRGELYYNVYYSENGKPRSDLNQFEKNYCAVVRNERNYYRDYFIETTANRLLETYSSHTP